MKLRDIKTKRKLKKENEWLREDIRLLNKRISLLESDNYDLQTENIGLTGRDKSKDNFQRVLRLPLMCE